MRRNRLPGKIYATIRFSKCLLIPAIHCLSRREEKSGIPKGGPRSMLLDACRCHPKISRVMLLNQLWA